MKKYIYNIFIIFSIFIIACKKETKVVPIDTPSKNGTRAELTKDSLYLYAKQVYLWNDDLPSFSAINPRSYNSSTNQLTNFNKLLFKITRYGINPINGKPYEYNEEYPDEPKFSYIEDLVANGTLSNATTIASIDLRGKGNDFGLGVEAIGEENNYQIYFKYISPNSPADKAGLHRGDKVNKINGRSIGTNFSAEVDFINEAFFDSSTIRLMGTKSNGNSFDVTLNKTTYDSSPIYKDSVYTINDKKIGYLAYARFSDEVNSIPALNRTFEDFANKGVTDLIIDLRYNGGGYVSTAQHLINLIAPNRINGSKMFSEHFNSTMQEGRATILKLQPARDGADNIIYENGKMVTLYDYNYSVAANTFNIQKTGQLNNIEKVVFIISGSTASASELVINSLKPYITVKTVGTTSYGKPVGFFPIRIDKYDVYYSMFSTKNSAGEGNYFAGMVPTKEVRDDLTKDFGDRTENNLEAAIQYLTTGNFPASTFQTMNINGKKVANSQVNIMPINNDGFKGMIENRRRK